MNDNILSWNVENWLSVILMASIGFGILAVAQKLYAKQQAGE